MALLGTFHEPASSQGLSSIKTVFVILFENTNWSQLTPAAAPYIRNTLVPSGAHAEHYFTPPGNHPSEPNYIWMEAGDHLGRTTDHDASASNSTPTTDHLVRYLENAGITWKTYQEDIDGLSCPLTSSGLYAAKHNPFVFFQDITDHGSPGSAHCIAHNRPYIELATDLQKDTVARYNVITPNLCHDMHDCGIPAGDAWLRHNLPAILNSQAYTDNGAVFLVWDEGAGGSDGPIPLIVLSSLAKVNYSNSIAYTHSSLLRTMQMIFGVGPPTNSFLRDAVNATDLSDLFVTATGRPRKAG
jgi:phospholipase C